MVEKIFIAVGMLVVTLGIVMAKRYQDLQLIQSELRQSDAMMQSLMAMFRDFSSDVHERTLELTAHVVQLESAVNAMAKKVGIEPPIEDEIKDKKDA